VSTGTLSWRGSGDLGEIITIARKPSKADIFLQLCPTTAIVTIIRKANHTEQKGTHDMTVKEILLYWAVRIYIHASDKNKLCENFPLPAAMFPKPMSHIRYKRLQRAWITPEAVQILNRAAAELVIFPEVITIDEKLRGYRGETPYRRHVPNKDPNNGHWITEATIKGSFTGLPYLVNAFPVQQNEGPTMLDFYQHTLRDVPERKRHYVVVVSDAYYLDDKSRCCLFDASQTRPGKEFFFSKK
jgi:hypothetical protein